MVRVQLLGVGDDFRQEVDALAVGQTQGGERFGQRFGADERLEGRLEILRLELREVGVRALEEAGRLEVVVDRLACRGEALELGALFGGREPLLGGDRQRTDGAGEFRLAVGECGGVERAREVRPDVAADLCELRALTRSDGVPNVVQRRGAGGDGAADTQRLEERSPVLVGNLSVSVQSPL